jgi:hypothetical protein
MIVKILATTQYALSRLRAAKEIKIHSVYRNTVNLLCDSGRMLSLHPRSTPLSPIGLLADLKAAEFSALGFSNRSKAITAAGGLSVDNILFSFQGVQLAETTPMRISETQERRLCDRISGALRQMSQNTVFCDLLLGGEKYRLSPVAVYTRDILLDAKTCLQNHEPVPAANHLTRLLGLGIGLTPSGDDFLCGVLAAAVMRGPGCDLPAALPSQILQKLDRTNRISGEFLRCACEGRFSRAVAELPLAKSAGEIALSFSKIGHSSGADTLNGILYIFSQANCLIGASGNLPAQKKSLSGMP